jgi:hypothetical protein
VKLIIIEDLYNYLTPAYTLTPRLALCGSAKTLIEIPFISAYWRKLTSNHHSLILITVTPPLAMDLRGPFVKQIFKNLMIEDQGQPM